jgi:oxygen-independent coproporphyrinogen-3 oxidase
MLTPPISEDLLERYDRPGPRYTSYPTAPSWSDDFGPADHAASLRRAAAEPGVPLSMYVHIPFCTSMCWYCGCSVQITQRYEKGLRYVDYVLKEAEIARRLLGEVDRPVMQHHWGGGTPTFLQPAELQRLFAGLIALWPLGEGAEVSIEVDPRVTTREQLEALRAAGFNRISMGVQDLDPQVQEAIHRIQPVEMTRDLVTAARELGFVSVNLDVVYGLPLQTPESFGRSIDEILRLNPDRLACYGYAHVPWLKKHQQVIDEASLPKGRGKLALYLVALEKFQAAGFAAIGMDHFAKPGDALALAADRGELHRNFMGYTTQPAEDMLSFGMTSISEIAGAFAQNDKTLADYEGPIDRGELPVHRGMRRSADDEARRRIILDLMCRFRLRFADHGGREAFLAKYGPAVEALQPMAEDGLCGIDEDGILVAPAGRMLVRNLAMPFDAYLEAQRAGQKPMFSRTV